MRVPGLKPRLFWFSSLPRVIMVVWTQHICIYNMYMLIVHYASCGAAGSSSWVPAIHGRNPNWIPSSQLQSCPAQCCYHRYLGNKSINGISLSLSHSLLCSLSLHAHVHTHTHRNIYTHSIFSNVWKMGEKMNYPQAHVLTISSPASLCQQYTGWFCIFSKLN